MLVHDLPAMESVLKLAVRKGGNLFLRGATWRGFYSPYDIATSTPFSHIAKNSILAMELRSLMRESVIEYFEELANAEEAAFFNLHRIASYPDMIREIISFI